MASGRLFDKMTEMIVQPSIDKFVPLGDLSMRLGCESDILSEKWKVECSKCCKVKSLKKQNLSEVPFRLDSILKSRSIRNDGSNTQF